MIENLPSIFRWEARFNTAQKGAYSNWVGHPRHSQKGSIARCDVTALQVGAWALGVR